MRKILLFLCLISSPLLFAQLPQSLVKSIKRTTTFDDYEGSIYMKSRYKEASVIDEKSGTFDANLRFNIYTDAIEYTINSNLYEVMKRPTIHVRIDGDYLYYCDFKNQRGLKRSGYYVLVELNEKYRIYKKLTLNITEPEKNTLTQLGEPGRIKSITTYYLEENGMIMELPTSKKDMLATFSDKQEELKKYIKKEKIRLRKEEDLIRFVARYNALKSIDSSPSRSLLSNRGRSN
ncbi:hypothetical protein [Aquimarina sp. 2201CG5-10]|uniref:hypothetical protein n=1 Tax=Aquimarina callyspongiae TaxID=3098150 RepID=UPI002AB383D8|nr:hypothetical protein [Aquimarina sp. 2201CG5-10]MDY8136683.1 hypothetical protein [Aquimarina sp. 2201CG5-10]